MAVVLLGGVGGGNNQLEINWNLQISVLYQHSESLKVSNKLFNTSDLKLEL